MLLLLQRLPTDDVDDGIIDTKIRVVAANKERILRWQKIWPAYRSEKYGDGLFLLLLSEAGAQV